jgi:hypothetical protein
MSDQQPAEPPKRKRGPRGPHRRTLARLAAAAVADRDARLAVRTGDVTLMISALAAMDEALVFFMTQARRIDTSLRMGADQIEATPEQLASMNEAIRMKGAYYHQAVHVAEKLAPYRYPKLVSAQVGGDPNNPLLIDDEMSAADIFARMLERARKTGKVPQVLSRLDAGLANREND